MNKKLVTSLELSRELKELGVKQESEFYWEKFPRKWELMRGRDKYDTPKERKLKYASAFLSGELGEMLPAELWKDEVHLALMIQKIHIGDKKFPDYGKFGTTYLNVPSMSNVLHSEVDTLPEAMGKMPAHLIKEKLIK